MALKAPKAGWYREPLSPLERAWLALAAVFAILFITLFMSGWHLFGPQRVEGRAYRVEAAAFREKVMAFAERYQVGEEKGVPVVAPPPGDIYLMAQAFSWYPVLRLKRGETYRLHVASVDLPHGFSLYPHQWSLQLHPGYEWVYTFTPTQAGVFHLVCNEYCGLGHQLMVGEILVEE